MPKRVYLFDYNNAMVTPIEGNTTYVRKGAFIKEAWDWIEDNMLSSNQQDNSNFYFKQFVNYMKGE